jgi:phosphogluconate dehydratase
MIRVNGQTGELTLLVDEAELAARQPHIPDLSVARGNRTRNVQRCVRNSPARSRAQPVLRFKTT